MNERTYKVVGQVVEVGDGRVYLAGEGFSIEVPATQDDQRWAGKHLYDRVEVTVTVKVLP